MSAENAFHDDSRGTAHCVHCGADLWDSLEAPADATAADRLLVSHAWRCSAALEAGDHELISAVRRNPDLMHHLAHSDEEELRRAPHATWSVVLGLAALLLVTLALLAR